MSSLSLLQRIFTTQKLNRGLLHCRRILYHLSYKGSPRWSILKQYLLIELYLFFFFCIPMKSLSFGFRITFLVTIIMQMGVLKANSTNCLVVKLCPILCDFMGCSLPGSSVHELSQARILELVAISFSRGSNPHFLCWQADSLPLSHQGSPILQIHHAKYSNNIYAAKGNLLNMTLIHPQHHT